MLLTAPTDNRPINVAPDLDVEGHVYRAWLRGNGWVRPDDVEYMPADVDRASWERRVKTSVSVVFHTHRALLDALEPFLAAGGHDAMAAASASLEDAQRSLDEFARAVAERNDPRPASRHRVSKAA